MSSKPSEYNGCIEENILTQLLYFEIVIDSNAVERCNRILSNLARVGYCFTSTVLELVTLTCRTYSSQQESFLLPFTALLTSPLPSFVLTTGRRSSAISIIVLLWECHLYEVIQYTTCRIRFFNGHGSLRGIESYVICPLVLPSSAHGMDAAQFSPRRPLGCFQCFGKCE